MTDPKTQSSPGWTWLAALVAVFMVAIDTLVVTTALPVIRADLHVGIEGVEWTVNGYTLTFAVFLLTGAALGDRYGRRLVFGIGLAIFTLASAGAALSTTIGELVAARVVQGFGAAIVLPLTLTLLASVVPPEKRGHAFGLWGAMVGLGIALGPVIGGSITEQFSWQWIFWVNVPVGLILLPLLALVRESRGGAGRLDLVGTVLVTAGLFGVVYALIRGNDRGWSSAPVLTGLIAGGVLVLLFIAWEGQSRAPMVPLGLFKRRGFSLTMLATIIMPFGVFGAVFLMAQYLQNALGYSPLGAGLRTLPWTAMPMIAAPISGRLVDKIGGKPLLIIGFLLQTVGVGWLAFIVNGDVTYGQLVIPFILTGLGLGIFLPPIAGLAIGFAPPELEGVASGTSNAIRQLGTVLGVSVAGALFSAYGGYTSKAAFSDGLVAAYKVAAIALGVGFLIALIIPNFIPASHEAAAHEPVAPEPARV